jgi:hypothetical protein
MEPITHGTILGRNWWGLRGLGIEPRNNMCIDGNPNHYTLLALALHWDILLIIHEFIPSNISCHFEETNSQKSKICLQMKSVA